MTLVIYDTLRREKTEFVPLDPNHVRLYVCGPTVYDFAHIGNARPAAVFDTFARLLRWHYPKVTYARNITDIEDKIIARAAEEQVTIYDLTARTAAIYHEDMAALNVLPPDIEPRATDHVEEMIEIITTLIEKKHAYEADGHVLFDTLSMANYGQFARKDQDELINGARVEVAPYKKNPTDFVLWKPSNDAEPGWDSPWGKGRPGWHIECSAMSKKHLGVSFDIHGGGLDLIFPHHQNEIAQSECAHEGAAMAKYWMHNGFVNVEGQKMSKSLGNFVTVHDLLGEFSGEALRLTLMLSHYRQPLDFTRDGVRQAQKILDRWYRAAADTEAAAELPATVISALDDDLNTPKAIAEMHKLADQASAGDKDAAASLRASAQLLGVLEQSAEEWFQGHAKAGGPSADDIEALIVERKEARTSKNFARADQIRDDLIAQGVLLEDGPDGTTWRRAS
jgi:cysteinyl-tRNA synthetase